MTAGHLAVLERDPVLPEDVQGLHAVLVGDAFGTALREAQVADVLLDLHRGPESLCISGRLQGL